MRFPRPDSASLSSCEGICAQSVLQVTAENGESRAACFFPQVVSELIPLQVQPAFSKDSDE